MDAQQTLDDWLSPKRFALLLIILIVVAFPSVVFGAQTFVHRDFGLYGYPVAHYHRECFWRGELPLWNPYNNCGLPFLAQWGTLVLYPLSLIYLLQPLPWGLNLFCLFHLFLAGTGMYVLARHLTDSRFAASVAGLVFAFNGFTQNCLMWPNYMAGLAWMPWLVYAVTRALREGGYRIIGAGFIGAMQMLTGTPELTLCTWLLLAGWWLNELLVVKPSRFALISRFSLVVVIVAGIAAAQLLPFLDLLAHSQRHERSATSQWTLPLWGWANFLVPLFRFVKYGSVAFQRDQALTSSYYMGIAIVALALVAIWQKRTRQTFLLAGAGLGSLLLAFGEPGYVYAWLRSLIPQIGFMRFPVKFVMIIAFVGPLLAAHGIKLLSRPGNDSRKTTHVLAAVASALLLFIGGICWFSYRFPVEDEVWSRTLTSGLTRSLFLLLTLVALAGLVWTVQPKKQLLWQCLALALICLDLQTHTPPQNPTLNPSIFTSALPSIDDLKPKPALGQSRALLSMEALERFNRPGITNLFQTYFGFRLGLYGNCNLLNQIPMADGYYSLYLGEERDIHFRLYGADDRPRTGLAAFLNVSQVSAPGNILEWETRNYMPLVTGGQRPLFADRDRTLAGLMSSNFAPRQIVFLPPAAQSSVTVSNQAPIQCLQEKVSSHRIEVETQADTAAMVVVAQAFYHHWRAYVDGQEVKLWPANHAFQALEVPKGHHQIQLVYQDRVFLLGAFISATTALVCGCSWFWLGRKRMEEPQAHVV